MKKNLIIPLMVSFLSIGFVIISLLVIATKGNNTFFVSKKLKIGGLILAMTVMFYACSSSNDVGQGDVMCYKVAVNENNNDNDENCNENTNEDENNMNNDNSSNNSNENNINTNETFNDNDFEPPVICYRAVVDNYVSLYNPFVDGFIVLDLSENNTIKGEVYYFKANLTFSYALREAKENFQEIGETYQTGNIEIKEANSAKGYQEFEIVLDQSLEAGDYHLFFYDVAVDMVENNIDGYINAFNIRITK